jgi:hypothetical protein
LIFVLESRLMFQRANSAWSMFQVLEKNVQVG